MGILKKLDELEGYGMAHRTFASGEFRPSYDRQERLCSAISTVATEKDFRAQKSLNGVKHIKALVYLVQRKDAKRAQKHIVGDGEETITDGNRSLLFSGS